MSPRSRTSTMINHGPPDRGVNRDGRQGVARPGEAPRLPTIDGARRGFASRGRRLRASMTRAVIAMTGGCRPLGVVMDLQHVTRPWLIVLCACAHAATPR